MSTTFITDEEKKAYENATKLTDKDIDFIDNLLNTCIEYNKLIDIEINRKEYFYDEDNYSFMTGFEYRILMNLISYYCYHLKEPSFRPLQIFNDYIKSSHDKQIMIRSLKTFLNQELKEIRIRKYHNRKETGGEINITLE